MITSIRILLVVPIAAALVQRQYALTLALFGAAAVSDAVDGLLARRFGWQSNLGGVLDPAADKLLLASAFVTLAYLQLAPWWLMEAAVARDVIIVAGAVTYRHWIGPLTARPSAVSKMNTVCQAAFVAAVIGRAQFAVPPEWLITVCGALVFVTVMVSGIDYVLVYSRQAARARAARHSAPLGS